MVEYTINAVNLLLTNLKEDTYSFLGSAVNKAIEEKIPTPYTTDYLKMIRERAQDINFLGRDITQLVEGEIKEMLHAILDDIIENPEFEKALMSTLAKSTAYGVKELTKEQIENFVKSLEGSIKLQP